MDKQLCGQLIDLKVIMPDESSLGPELVALSPDLHCALRDSARLYLRLQNDVCYPFPCPPACFLPCTRSLTFVGCVVKFAIVRGHVAVD
jgi:hypothetical protein